MFLSFKTVPMYWHAHKIFFMNRWCEVNPKNRRNLNNLVRTVYSRNSHSFRQYIGAEIDTVVPAFLHFMLSGRSSCLVVLSVRSFQLSGHSSCPVIPALRSFQLSGHSSCPVVPAVRLFQLSVRSSCPVIPAVRSFQLSDCSSCPVVPAVWSFWLFCGRSNPCNQKKLKKGEAHPTIYCVLPIVNLLLIFLDWAEMEISFVKQNNKIKVKITLDRHGSRLILSHCHQPSFLSTLFFVTVYL